MRYPDFLKENGTIGFVAPSFGCAIEPYRSAFHHALSKWKKMGYQTKLGPNCYENRGIGISNTPKLCGEELNEAYCENDSDVLISCGGGELMCEVIPYMDFERIRKAKPKWYMGYSDNTNFTFLLATICDTAAIYGPCAAAFGMEPWHDSIRDAFDLLCGKRKTVHGYEKWEKEGIKDEEHPLVPYHVTEPLQIKSFPERKVQMTGRLLGGCMDCLVILLGTEYDHVKEFLNRYQEDGVIWFLESCELNIMAIRRAIWQMKHAGWFSHVKGFLIGRPLCHGTDMFGIDQYRAVTDLLSEYHVPIVMDVDIGHLPPMMPIICGCTANVSVDGNEIQIEYTFEC